MEVYIEQIPTRKQRTKIIKNSLFPEFNERLGLQIPVNLISDAILHVHVMDKEMISYVFKFRSIMLQLDSMALAHVESNYLISN